MSVRYLSVCSGIEAASCAWHPLGWQAVAFSEIDSFPSAVLAHHYPTVPNWGDMTKFREWPDAVVDVLVGGTPCQSFSVAGLRKGLADPRGNLMLTYLAIADRYRPEWLVWENVPGVLSSNGGRDFGTFLGGLAELGYGFAYRVLDAQYFGVPQRRRRVFVVGCLGDWRRAAAVLFERESLRGNPAPSRETGKGVATTISARTKGGGGLGTDFDCDGGLIPERARALTSSNQRIDAETETLLIAHSLRADGFYASEDGTGRGTPIVPVAFSCKDHGADAGDIAPTLRSMNEQVGNANAGGQVAVAFNWQAGGGGVDESFRGKSRSWITRAGDYTGSLGATKRDAVAFDARQSDVIQYGDKTGPLDTCGFTMGIQSSMQVRRLTPTECERLQGFPDGYTLITYRGKPAADGPRYKALGNSMAVPCMRWIGERIDSVRLVCEEYEAVA